MIVLSSNSSSDREIILSLLDCCALSYMAVVLGQVDNVLLHVANLYLCAQGEQLRRIWQLQVLRPVFVVHDTLLPVHRVLSAANFHSILGESATLMHTVHCSVLSEHWWIAMKILSSKYLHQCHNLGVMLLACEVGQRARLVEVELF